MQEENLKKQLEDERTTKVMYRTTYRFQGSDREILLICMQDVPQKDIAKKLSIPASAVSQRIKILLEEY